MFILLEKFCSLALSDDRIDYITASLELVGILYFAQGHLSSTDPLATEWSPPSEESKNSDGGNDESKGEPEEMDKRVAG